jgi:hypothetical protein
MFEKKKKNKAHKPKSPTWPLKPTSSHYSLYSHHTRLFFNGALNERSVDSNWGVVAAKDYFFLVFFSSFLSSFLPRNYFLYFSFSLAMIG